MHVKKPPLPRPQFREDDAFCTCAEHFHSPNVRQMKKRTSNARGEPLFWIGSTTRWTTGCQRRRQTRGHKAQAAEDWRGRQGKLRVPTPPLEPPRSEWPEGCVSATSESGAAHAAAAAAARHVMMRNMDWMGETGGRGEGRGGGGAEVRCQGFSCRAASANIIIIIIITGARLSALAEFRFLRFL